MVRPKHSRKWPDIRSCRSYSRPSPDAAGYVAGPQLRNSETIGGNLCLDTRYTYYNQTSFWRGALGYCPKKDGTVCHVTNVGKKCVAAHSADTHPVLMTLGAMVTLAGPEGERRLPIEDIFITDVIYNTRKTPEKLSPKSSFQSVRRVGSRHMRSFGNASRLTSRS